MFKLAFISLFAGVLLFGVVTDATKKEDSLVQNTGFVKAGKNTFSTDQSFENGIQAKGQEERSVRLSSTCLYTFQSHSACF